MAETNLSTKNIFTDFTVDDTIYLKDKDGVHFLCKYVSSDPKNRILTLGMDTLGKEGIIELLKDMGVNGGIGLLGGATNDGNKGV